jgi:hypothetical protein
MSSCIARSALCAALVCLFGVAACGDDTEPANDAGTQKDKGAGRDWDVGPGDGPILYDTGPDQATLDSALPDKQLPDKQLVCHKVPCDCKLKGKNLWGKVYFAKYASQADFKVYEAKYSGSAALRVYKAAFSTQASSCGRWYEVSYSSQADIKVYKSPYSSGVDFTYVPTTFLGQAGMTCSFCP